MFTWRSYRAGDELALRAVQRRQCARTGETVACPDPRDPMLLMMQIACREGRPAGALLARAAVDLMYIGDDGRLLLHALRRAEDFRRDLRDLGASEVRISAFRPLLPKLEPLLARAGFRRANPDYLEFFQEL